MQMQNHQWLLQKHNFRFIKSGRSEWIVLLIFDAGQDKTNDDENKFKGEGTTIAMISDGLSKKIKMLDVSVNNSF